MFQKIKLYTLLIFILVLFSGCKKEKLYSISILDDFEIISRLLQKNCLYQRIPLKNMLQVFFQNLVFLTEMNCLKEYGKSNVKSDFKAGF